MASMKRALARKLSPRVPSPRVMAPAEPARRVVVQGGGDAVDLGRLDDRAVEALRPGHERDLVVALVEAEHRLGVRDALARRGVADQLGQGGVLGRERGEAARQVVELEVWDLGRGQREVAPVVIADGGGELVDAHGVDGPLGRARRRRLWVHRVLPRREA
jgi:hypothetical protein